MISRNSVLNEMANQVGITEYPPNSNNVKYNTWYYGREVSGSAYPWCVTFVQWLFRNDLVGKLFIKTASSSALLTQFENHHQVVCENLKKPGVPISEAITKARPGDIVFFKFSWDRDCKAEHVGMIEDVDNDLQTIEGNTSFSDKGSQDNGGAVARRHRKGNIVAIVRPNYDAEIQNGGKKETNTTTVSSPETTIWKFLSDKGLNDYAVAGLIGNLMAESGLKANNLQNYYNTKLNMSDEQYTSAVDNGSYTNFVRDAAGYGLAQWTYYTRKQGLIDYARKTGRSIGDLNMQLEYLWGEINTYKQVMSVLKNAKSVKEASDVVLTKFERPANMGESVKNKRASLGQQIYDRHHK